MFAILIISLLESSSKAPPQRDKPKQEGWA